MRKLASMATVGFMIVSALILTYSIPYDEQDVPPLPSQPARILSTSGDAYSGSGNWLISNPTVYVGESLTVYHNIYINGTGSLTLYATTLTLDESSDSEHKIFVQGNGAKLKVGTGSILKTNNATTGAHNGEVNTAWSDQVMVSNATVRNFYFYIASTNPYFDNSTFYGCEIYGTNGAGWNITGNTFRAFNSDHPVKMTGAAMTCNILHNTFLYINATHTDASNLFGVIVVNTIGGAAHVDHNTIQSTVTDYGIFMLAPGSLSTIDGNHIYNVSVAKIAATGFGAGIYVTGNGHESMISNNTIDLMYSRTTGSANYGIYVYRAASYWNVADNHITMIRMQSNIGQEQVGICTQTSYIDIYRNHIGNVYGSTLEVGNASSGILLGGSIGTAPTTVTHITCQNNTVDLATGVTNGIVVGFLIPKNEINTVRIANNTINGVANSSVGIGAYWHLRNITIVDNHVHNVTRTCAGIRFATNTTYLAVNRNVITIIDSEDMSYADAGSWVPGAISFVAENNHNTGSHSVYYDNVITVVNQWSDLYPDFNMTGCYNGIPLDIHTDQSLLIQYYDSNFGLSATNLALLNDNGTLTFCTASSGSWSRIFYGNVTSGNHFAVLRVNVSTMTMASGTMNFTFLQFSTTGDTIAQWNQTGSGNAVFDISGLSDHTSYRVFKNGTFIGVGYGPSFSFTTDGSGLYEIRVSYGKEVSILVGLTIDMLALGILVSVIAPTVKMLRNDRLTSEQKTRGVIQAVIFIVIALAMLSIVYNIAYG